MAKTGHVKVELHLMSLKSIIPIIPGKEEEKLQLVEDLTKMGYERLLVEPWMLKSKFMVQEFQREHPNDWEGTIHRDPEHRTADSWAKTYNFRKEGRKKVGGTNKCVEGKFKTSIDPKDGYAIVDCIDPREPRVLEF